MFHIHLEIWVAAGLIFIGIYPVLLHLFRGWVIKRDDIFSSLSTTAKDRYLDNFQARSASPRAHNVSADEEFKSLYNSRYGRWNYIVPTLLLASVLVPACYLMSVTGFTQINVLSAKGHENIFAILDAPHPYLTLPPIAAAGVVGAYLWIVAELISASQQVDLSPSDILRSSLRLIVAAPLGYAIGSLSNQAVAPFVAFAVGAFPLDRIGIILRRLTNRQLKLDIEDGGQPDQVAQLEGVDSTTAERLREAGVTTVAQLAYYDPVGLSMRTGLAFDFILDLVGQALAWIYFGKKLDMLRPAGLRGAIEISNLYDEYQNGRGEEARSAKSTVNAAAKLIDLNENLFLNACGEIAGDPATVFLDEVWQSTDTPSTRGRRRNVPSRERAAKATKPADEGV